LLTGFVKIILMQISKKFVVLASILGLAAGTAGTIALQTHAATTATTNTTTGQTTAPTGKHGMWGTPPAAAGKVTAVDTADNTITVTDAKSGTSFTVDASGAAIQKFTPPAAGQKPAAPQTITVGQIQIGDSVMVQGTVSGTTITATKITDGTMMGGFRGGPGGMGMRGAAGTVSGVNGTTITLTGKNGTTYTVDASGANVEKVSASSVANIAVGDTLRVSGSTSGSTITAKNIIDGQLGLMGK
jgi:hypothetical protein